MPPAIGKILPVEPALFRLNVRVVLLCLILTGLNVSAQIEKRDSLFQVVKNAKTDSVKILGLTGLSKWFIHSDFREATRYAEEALMMSKVARHPSLMASALTSRALLYWHNGEYISSVALNRKAIRLRKKIIDDAGTAENYFAIGMDYYYSADYDSAIWYHQKALTLFNNFLDQRRSAEVLNLIGLVYHRMGNYPKAIYYLHEFSRVRQNLTGYQGRTYNLGSSSPYFRAEEYFKTELDLQLKALEELRQSKDKESLLLTYLNIADTYKELHDFHNALIFHKRAAAFAVTIGVNPEYTYLGNAYRAIGEVDSAIQIHQSARTLIELTGNKLDLLNTYINLGKDYDILNDHELALKYYMMALRLTTQLNNKLDIVINSHRVARTLMALRQYEESKIYAASALRFALKIKAKTFIRDSYDLLAEIEARLKHFEAVYSYQKASKLLVDSLVAGEANLQFAQMQIQFELDKKEEDIRILNQEKQIQETKIRNKDQFIMWIIIVLALSILLAVSTFLRFRQKNKANKILQEQKHQIEILLAEIHHRVKNNLQIISSLLSIQSDRLEDINAKMALLEGQSRVQVMGLIHENIYKTDNFSFIEMKGYIQRLTTTLLKSFGYEDRVMVDIDVAKISIDVDTAIQLGLIINELFTNSLKHAFLSIDRPCVRIKLQVDEANQLSLKQWDNGIGFLMSADRQSFGLTLVRELTFQMGGEIDFFHEEGFGISLRLKKFKLAA